MRIIFALLVVLAASTVSATPVCQDHENEHGFACRDTNPPKPVSVPEPSTVVLVGAGLLTAGLVTVRLRRTVKP